MGALFRKSAHHRSFSKSTSWFLSRKYSDKAWFYSVCSKRFNKTSKINHVELGDMTDQDPMGFPLGQLLGRFLGRPKVHFKTWNKVASSPSIQDRPSRTIREISLYNRTRTLQLLPARTRIIALPSDLYKERQAVPLVHHLNHNPTQRHHAELDVKAITKLRGPEPV